MTDSTITSARARDLIARFDGRRILVVGDVMLDRFIVGRVTRISPEAPVPVVRFQEEYFRLGGAANVANNLAALGADVSLIGVTGVDTAATQLKLALGAAGLSVDHLIDAPGRPTVEKTRIVTDRQQHVARIDHEDDVDVDGDVEGRVVDRIEQIGRSADALLVSDYLKGAITRAVMRSLVALKSAGRPLVVDPKIPHLDYYAGAGLVTPNNQEAEEATHRRIRSDADARSAAGEFRTRARCDAALITRGDQGMWLASESLDVAIPACAREVSDVTGAGDTVVATVTLALAAGATLVEAAALANQAAGIVVGKFGPATVTRDELLSTLS